MRQTWDVADGDPWRPLPGARHVELPPTAKGRRTYARLLESGRRMLEEHGVDVPVSYITNDAGVSLGTMYRYFPNKDVLFRILLEELTDELYESVVAGQWVGTAAAGGDILGAIRTGAKEYLDTYYRNRHLISALISHRDYRPVWWDLRNRTYRTLEVYLRETPVAKVTDPYLAASALGSMVDRFAFHWYMSAPYSDRPSPSVDDAAETLTHIWYRAVFCPSELTL